MVYVTVLFPLLAIWSPLVIGDTSPLLLSVYYESYSPQSIEFIKQFYKTWKEFRKFLEVELVPFGQTQMIWGDDGTLRYNCTHGPVECKANRQHACALKEACPGGTVGCAKKEVDRALHYINCVVKEKDQRSANHMCGARAGLTSRNIKECYEGDLGKGLEAQNAEKSNVYWIKNNVDTVPFITVNGIFSDREQGIARSNLRSLICFYLPEQCL